MTVPEAEVTITIFIENRVIRTGMLGYYDPLMLGDFYSMTLGDMDAVDDTLPATDPNLTHFPEGVNATLINLTI